MSDAETLALVDRADESVDHSQRLGIASAQLAIALAADPNSPEPIKDRILLSTPTDALEPVDLLTAEERTFLQAARTIVGLMYDEANESANRAARLIHAPRRQGW